MLRWGEVRWGGWVAPHWFIMKHCPSPLTKTSKSKAIQCAVVFAIPIKFPDHFRYIYPKGVVFRANRQRSTCPTEYTTLLRAWLVMGSLSFLNFFGTFSIINTYKNEFIYKLKSRIISWDGWIPCAIGNVVKPPDVLIPMLLDLNLGLSGY